MTRDFEKQQCAVDMLHDLGYAVILWHEVDIKENHPDLDDAHVKRVLEEIEEQHDATLGVSWDTIDYLVDYTKGE